MNNLSPNTPFCCATATPTLFSPNSATPSPLTGRELLSDSTGKAQVAYDFVDSPNPDAPLVVLFHGLEGSSPQPLRGRTDARGTKQRLEQRGRPFPQLRRHLNTAPVFYHRAIRSKSPFMLDTLAARYSVIYAAGVSLGGNALAKYSGEQGSNALPRAAAAVSAPVDATLAGTPSTRHVAPVIYPLF